MIEEFFTDYDDSISGESFRDPMGLQVIWSALGQEIFGRQITSIANDLRNFTQALFQHYVVRDIVNDVTITIPEFTKEYYGSKDDAVFKRSLIIFLENLFIYTAVLEGLDPAGLLGSQSAGHKLSAFKDGPIIAAHENSGILVRQISLGVNGRYKTPLMNIELLNGQYEYKHDSSIWEQVEACFKEWKEAIELKDLLKRILVERFNSGRSKSFSKEDIRPYRELTEDSIKNAIVFKYNDITEYHSNLRELYKAVLVNQGGSREFFGEFWKAQLGLNKGAAKAIYDTLTNVGLGQELTNKDLLDKAIKTEGLDVDEKRKIDNIFATEPLLALVSNVFSFICCREISDLADVRKHIDQIEINEAELRKQWNDIQWQAVQQTAGEMKNKFPTAGSRLADLSKNTDWSLELCVREIITYHKNLMGWRGLFPWVAIDDKGKIRHTGRSYSVKDCKYKEWIHDYYLWSLKNLHKGLNGESK